MRKPMIAGNWKLHKTISEATSLVSELMPAVASNQNVEIVVAPVYTALAKVAEALAGSNIKLAAQNCYPEPQGAFTGEVSPLLLKDAGCEYVIIGHSERRQLFAETDGSVNSKALALADSGLGTIFCIGETLEERESGKMFDVLRQQVTAGLKDLTTRQMQTVVVAYEPVWAIGTGKVATDEQAQEVHAFIRGLLAELYEPQTAAATRILYGGSVKPGNVDGLMTQPDVDGALVGGASLNADDFARIANFEAVA
ncbi:MAG: triose-phosphate isomerase [Desulfuromonadales bacterium]|jgi:triosephosphate isomerase|nr:triose-phosphate isomerase [Desulfuromonadales bacterium]